jgi:hypothetical protein
VASDLGHPKLPQGLPNPIPFHLIWGNDATKSIDKEIFVNGEHSKYVEFWKMGGGCAMMKLMPKSLVHMWLIRKTSLSCCQILCPFKIQPFWNVFGLPAIGGLITCKVPFPPLLMLILKTELSFHIMVLGSMHGWVNQFTTKPKFFFIQKNGQILEITTSLH